MEKSKIKGYQRVLSMFLLVVMLLTMIPYEVFADVNVDTGETTGSGSSGSTDNWALPRKGSGRFGTRISIFWAPSLADMEKGVNVEQIGNVVDIANKQPINSNYNFIKYSSENSVMDYMAKGVSYNVTHRGSPYSDHRLINSGSLVTTQPDIEKDPTAQEWIDWFEGKDAKGEPTYKVIGEIAKQGDLGITAEDFKTGAKNDVSGLKVYGQYKLFFEPILYGKYGSHVQGMTFRDIVFYSIARDKGGLKVTYLNGPKEWGGNNRVTSNMTEAASNTANPTYLSKDDKSINMVKKLPGYSVSKLNREEAIKPGSPAYNSMGVGVVTPPAKEAPKNKILVSYVKVVDYKDGKFVYETIKETEEEAVKYIKGKESEGILDIDAVREVEEGTALLNDIITTKNDYTEKVVEKKKEVKDLVWETGIKPKLKEEPIVEPEEVY